MPGAAPVPARRAGGSDHDPPDPAALLQPVGDPTAGRGRDRSALAEHGVPRGQDSDDVRPVLRRLRGDADDRRAELLDGSLQRRKRVHDLALRREHVRAAAVENEAPRLRHGRVARGTAPRVARDLHRLLLVDAVRLVLQEAVIPARREVDDVREVRSRERRRRVLPPA